MTKKVDSPAEKPVGGPVALLLIMLVLIGAVVGAMYYISVGGRGLDFLAPKPAPAPRVTTLEGMGWGVALVKCEEAVRAQLKDPQSASFPDEGQPVWNGTNWNYAGKVRATNSFGAYIVTSFVCQVNGTTQSDAVTTVNLMQ